MTVTTAEPTAYRWRWLALVAVLAAEIMDLVDGTVVGIAAPSIRAELGGGDAMIQWVAAGYTLAFAAGLITGGRLGDLYGRRRMFLLGLVGFVAASALCGLATTPGTLIGFRIAQGLLGAILIPQGFGILKATFPPDDLGKAFGAFGPTIGLAVVGAPILGGALIAWDVAGLGWRTVFLINVPLGLAALALAAAVLPESRADDGLRPDPVGMVLVSAGFALLVFPLVEGRELGWPGWAFAMIAIGVAVLGLFAVHQVRRSRAGRAPLVEPALFRVRAFSAGMAVGLALFAGMTGLVLALGLYLQLGLGYTPLQAGLAQAPWAVGVAVGSALSGAVLTARLGRTGLQLGTVVAAAGLGGVLLTVVTSGAAVTGWALAPSLAVCGLGLGLAMTPFFDITLAGVTLPLVGSASGVLNANQQLGGTIGVAVLGTLFFGLFDAGRPTGAMAAVLVASAALGLAAGALAFLLPQRAGAEG
jgi:EmrB/QacA subfamily drug resistance transporter